MYTIRFVPPKIHRIPSQQCDHVDEEQQKLLLTSHHAWPRDEAIFTQFMLRLGSVLSSVSGKTMFDIIHPLIHPYTHAKSYLNKICPHLVSVA